MSRYEKQQKIMRKQIKKMWTKTLVLIVIMYLAVIVSASILGMSTISVAKDMVIYTTLLVFGVFIGAYMESYKNKYLIPAPTKRESPELQNRV